MNALVFEAMPKSVCASTGAGSPTLRMAVAVVKDGKVVLAKGYGVRKLSEPAPVRRPDTLGHHLEHQGVHRHGPGPARRGR